MSNQKGFSSLVLLGSLLIIIFVSIGFYIWKSQSAKPVPQNPIVTTQTPPPNEEAMINWQIYSDDDLTFKYPEGWSMQDFTESLRYSDENLERDIRFIYDDQEQFPRTFDLIVVNQPIDVVSQGFKDNESSLLNGDFGDKTTVKTTVAKTNSKINDLSVIKVYSTSLFDYKPTPLIEMHYQVVTSMGDKTVELSGDNKDAALLDQIASTLKFLP